MPKNISNRGSSNDKSPQKTLKVRIKLFRKKIKKAVSSMKLPDSTAKNILAAVGVGGHSKRLCWSDTDVRKEASSCLWGLVQQHRKSGPKERCYYFATFVDDSGNTSDRLPVIRMSTFFQKVNRAIRRLGLPGLVVGEIAPLMNFPQGGKGRTLMLHSHALLWSDVPFDPVEAERQLNGNGSWHCEFGAQPVDIERIGRKKEDLERVIAYMFKPPHCAKNLRADKASDGRMKMVDTTEGYRPELALRMLEGLSQVDFFDVVYGVNHGTKLRQGLRERLREWHRQRASDGWIVAENFDFWACWAELRREKGSKNYFPFRFIGGSPDAVPAKKPARNKVQGRRAKSVRRPVRPPAKRLAGFQKRHQDRIRRVGRVAGKVARSSTPVNI